MVDHIFALAEDVPCGTLLRDSWIGSSLLALEPRQWYIGPGSKVGHSSLPFSFQQGFQKLGRRSNTLLGSC